MNGLGSFSRLVVLLVASLGHASLADGAAAGVAEHPPGRRGIAAGPQNEAVVAGSTLILRCESDAPVGQSRVAWYEYAYSPAGLQLSDNAELVPSHPHRERYRIIHERDTQFDLEIRDALLTDGGTYRCRDLNDNPPSMYYRQAELTVLASEPVCTSTLGPDGGVVEGFYYTLECDVTYRGNLVPTMTWTGPEPFTSGANAGSGWAWAGVAFNATREMELKGFQCVTNFTERIGGPLPPELASNVPEYRSVYQSDLLNVFWPPRNLGVVPILPSYAVGDILSCGADASPAPSYQWVNLRTIEPPLPPGRFFTVTPDLEGWDQTLRCDVQNEIMGSINPAFITVNVSVPVPTTPTTPTTPPSTPSTPPMDAPCDDPTGRWASTNPDSVMCVEMDQRGNLNTLFRNGTDLFFFGGNGKTVVGDYRHIGFSGIWPLQGGTAGFAGECHKCMGVEVILLSGLRRNKYLSDTCGVSTGTTLTRLYVMTRAGPPCRDLELDIVNANPDQLRKMGVRAKGHPST